MDPMAVIRAMWRHKWFVLPVLLITATAAVYVYQFGPRYYEASTSFAIVNPRVPTDQELLLDASLVNLNSDNPFLRSSDQALISEVLIARLTSSAVADQLVSDGLSDDYQVNKGINGNGFVVSITGSGASEAVALNTAAALGEELQSNLRQIQKVNDADDRFLFTALTVTPLDKATEQFSSRLRSVVVVILAGAILMFAAVSAARSVAVMRQNRRRKKEQGKNPGSADTAKGEKISDAGHGNGDDKVPTTMSRAAVAHRSLGKYAAGQSQSSRPLGKFSSRDKDTDGVRKGDHVSR